jgi:transposase-like protein
MMSPRKGGLGAGTNTAHYPPEFKREVVELYRSSGTSIGLDLPS